MPKRIQELNIGSKIKFGKHQIVDEEPQVINWLVVDKDNQTYGHTQSVTLLSEKIIDFKAYGADKHFRYTDANDEFSPYASSNIDEWLNKTGETKDSDYGCQITRIGAKGWTKEDIIRKPLFGMITDYLATYVSIANNIKAYL